MSILLPLSLSPPPTFTDDYLFKYIIVGDTGAVKEMNMRNNALVGFGMSDIKREMWEERDGGSIPYIITMGSIKKKCFRGR